MNRICKDIIAVLFALSIFIICIGIVGYYENHYTKTMTVTDIDKNTVYLVDSQGEEWSIYANNVKVNDKVKVLIFTNNTDNKITDDKIEKILKVY